VRVAAVVTDLMLFSRIEAAAAASGASLLRADGPADLPPHPPADLVLVDWSAREPDWADALHAWRASAPAARLILFGPHTDLDAHAAARDAGIGPMWARSKLVAELPTLLRD
jgi:DNA-binding transcriptional LysR family regulator